MEVETDEPSDAGFSSVVESIFVSYGWHLLLSLIIIIAVWTNVAPFIYKWQKKKEEEKINQFYEQNPDFVSARNDAMELARRKLQEQHDDEAAKYQEKMKMKAAAKLLAQSQPAEAAPANETVPRTQRLRRRAPSDLNPLTGFAGPSYRPSSRNNGGFSGGGGG